MFEAPPPPGNPDVALSAHLLVVTQHNTVRGNFHTVRGREVVRAEENVLVIETTTIIKRVETFPMTVAPNSSYYEFTLQDSFFSLSYSSPAGHINRRHVLSV